MLVSVEGDAPSSQVVVCSADVAAGDVNAQYRFLARAGAPLTYTELRGVSIRSLAENTGGVPASSVKYVEISTGAATLFAISGDDLASPSPFPDGTVPAVYSNSTDSLGYVTPLRADDQPNDKGVTSNGGVVSVTIHTTGRLLTPTIALDHPAIDAGSAVTFSASFPSDPGTAIDYSWDFGDGGTVSGAASESHAYSAAGTYQTTLTVRGADGSLGIAKSELITVGTPAPATNAAGGGSGVVATPAPTTGPTTTLTKKPVARSGSTPKATPKSTPKATPTPTPKATPTPRPRPKPTKTASTKPTSVPTWHSTPAPTSTATAQPTEPALGTTVTGVLISGDAAAATDGSTPSPSQSSSPSSAAAERAGARAALGWGSAAAAGTVVLLGAGVLIESGLASALLARLKRRIR